MLISVFFFIILIILIILVRLLIHKSSFDWEAKLFLSLTAVTLIAVFSAFFLAFINRFGLGNISLVCFLISIGLILFFFYDNRNNIHTAVDDLIPGAGDINYLFMVLAIGLFVLYISFPVYYLWGRRDPSVYFLMGVNISRNGNLLMSSNELLNQMYEQINSFADYSFRGFYPEFIYDPEWVGDFSVVQAQFLPVFPCALAVGFSLFGIEGLVRVPAIIAILCTLAIYNFVSLALNKKYGVLAAALMGICPAQIWGSRITQTELLCQLFYLLSSFLYLYSVKKHNSAYSLIFSGLMLGLSNLIRIDICLLGLGLLVAGGVLNVLYNKEQNWNLMVLPYFFVMFIAFYVNYKTSTEYIMRHMSYIFPVMLVSTLLLFFNLIVGNIKIRVLDIVSSFVKDDILSKKKSMYVFTSLFAFIIFKYLYLVRPLNQNGFSASYDFWQRCFKELFIYIPFVFYILFFIGIVYILLSNELFKQLILFLIIGAVTTVVYIYRPAIAPDHIWASRRWVTSVFPFIIIVSLVGLYAIERGLKNNLINIIIVTGSIVFMLDQSSNFLFQPMLKDMIAQYESLADKMDNNELYFVEKSHFGSYLRFFYNKNTIVLDPEKEQEFYDYINNSDRDVFFIGDIESLSKEYDYSVLYEGNLEGIYLKQSNYRLTRKLDYTGSVTNIYEIHPGSGSE